MLILLPTSEKKAEEAGPAIEVYTGVLYKALGWSTLSTFAQGRAQESLAIISAKYGVLRPTKASGLPRQISVWSYFLIVILIVFFTLPTVTVIV